MKTTTLLVRTGPDQLEPVQAAVLGPFAIHPTLHRDLIADLLGLYTVTVVAGQKAAAQGLPLRAAMMLVKMLKALPFDWHDPSAEHWPDAQVDIALKCVSAAEHIGRLIEEGWEVDPRTVELEFGQRPKPLRGNPILN